MTSALLLVILSLFPSNLLAAVVVLRLPDDQLQSLQQSLSSSSSQTPQPLTFWQFVKLGVCKDNIAYSCFEEADVDNDGYVTEEELEVYKTMSGNRADLLYDQFLNNSFETADTDKDGYVSYIESTDFAEDSLKIAADDNWRNFFYSFDTDNNQKLDEQEFDNLMTRWYRGDDGLVSLLPEQ